MIVYFADRKMNVLGSASTGLPNGLLVSDDLKSEDIETGVAVFECKIHFDKDTREKVERCASVGNYVLRSHKNENEFYTIIDTECDTKKQTVYIYAEDAGLDLLNEVVGEYEADKEYNINHYIETFAYDSGFRVRVNEASGLTRKLTFDDEETVTARLAKVAAEFDGCEISYSYAIKGLTITNKFINIHKQRGQDKGVTLRLNKDIDSIITSKSIVNLATALRCTGSTPEDAEDPITLRGYEYDDGDFYVDGDALKSRKALKQWSRYIWEGEPNLKPGHEGHIVKLFSYDTTSQKELLEKAIAELKILREIELNFDVEIAKLPDNVRIGDRVNIVDEAGELYLSTRILQLESSAAEQTHRAILGEHLIQKSGIHQKVATLAAQFAKTAKSATRALQIANNAKSSADEAQAKANTAATNAANAQKAADDATAAANTAQESANNAKTAADNAQAAVDTVEKSVETLETTVTNAQTAADNAQQAANTAQNKANEAATAAAQAKADAADAKEATEIAQNTAETAITKADTAQSTADTAKSDAATAQATADAAKLDAEQAGKDIDNLANTLETVQTTMQADYARKTDLTKTEASLQSQISQNAALISSTVSMLSIIDETTNDAQDQAEKAQKRAEEARTQADKATADANTAQAAADDAKRAAQEAQNNADTAQLAVDSAQAILDKAMEDLASAQADLESVQSRADATEAEIAAAQKAVEDAQTSANIAKADADEAAEKATKAQAQADTAQKSATEAQAVANTAASYAQIAQAVACEAENAYAAQARADEAASTANNAQTTADKANQAAIDAKEAADKAAQDAAQAVADAEAADAQVVQAAADLLIAKKHLSDVLGDVDATEEDIAEAQATVEAAQLAVDEAKAKATEAAAYAAQAAIDAAEAQAVADNAKTAADNAQQAADDAQQAADEAQAAVDSLAVRVTTAETNIKQTSEQISLMATKTEVAQTLGGYYTREEADAELAVKANEISLSVDTKIEGIDIGARNYFVRSKINNLGYRVDGTLATADVVKGYSFAVNPGEQWTLYRTDNTNNRWQLHWLDTEPAAGVSVLSSAFQKNSEPAYTVSYLTVPDGVTWGFLFLTTQSDEIPNIMLEKGNKATDWKPAPEDVDEKIESTDSELRRTITNQQTSILADCESIILSAVESRIEKSVYDEFKETVAAQLNVLADRISMNFTTAIEEITKVNGELQAEITERRKHIDFGEDGITIGSNENAIKMNLDNDQLVFSKHGVEIVRLDIDNFTPTNVYIKAGGRLQLGNFGFTVMADGSPIFGKVGG